MRPDQMPRQPFPADELDALSEIVRETVEEIDSGVVCRSPAWETIHAELIRLTARVQELELENAILEIKNRGTLANNLCPDHRDKQTGKPCLACTIETLTRKKDRAEAELAAMRKLVSDVYNDLGELQNPDVWARWRERAQNALGVGALLPLDDEAKS